MPNSDRWSVPQSLLHWPALYPHLILVVDNGRTFCSECHRQTPSYGYTKANVQRKPTYQIPLEMVV